MPAYIIGLEPDQEIKVIDLVNSEGIRIIVTVGLGESEEQEKDFRAKLAVVERTCKKWGKECEEALKEYVKCVFEVHVRTEEFKKIQDEKESECKCILDDKPRTGKTELAKAIAVEINEVDSQ